jgi:hypothetical protein
MPQRGGEEDLPDPMGLIKGVENNDPAETPCPASKEIDPGAEAVMQEPAGGSCG